jgi:putative FmdB family regulatory protein
MPIYLYNCEKCNTTAEYLVPLSKPVPERCVKCESLGSELKRVYDGQKFAGWVVQNKSSGK